MKKILYFILLLSNISLSAQSLGNLDSNPNTAYMVTSAGLYIMSSTTGKPIKKLFLYKDFYNPSVIYTNSKVNYMINNINVDLIDQNFVSAYKKDSLFTFTNVDKVKINDKIFLKKNKTILEVISQGKKVNLYIRYFAKKKEQELDKMNGSVSKPERFVLRKEFIFENAITKQLSKHRKIKRSIFLSMLDSKSKDRVTKYAKKNNLSYKNINELKKIINYYNSL